MTIASVRSSSSTGSTSSSSVVPSDITESNFRIRTSIACLAIP